MAKKFNVVAVNSPRGGQETRMVLICPTSCAVTTLEMLEKLMDALEEIHKTGLEEGRCDSQSTST